LLGTLAGWAITLAGLLAWRVGGSFGPLLALAGPAWLVAACAAPAAPSALVFTGALVLAHAAPALIAHAALGPGHRVLAAIPYVTCLGVAGLAARALFDPLAEGCPDCPENLVMVTSDAGAQLTVMRWGLAAGAAGLAAVVAVLVVRLARSSPARRLRDAPVLLAAAAFLSLSAAQLAHGVSRGFVSNDDLDRVLWASQALALLLLAVATAWDPLRRRRARGQLARLVVELADAPRRGGLRDSLAGPARRPRSAAAVQDRREGVGAPGRDSRRRARRRCDAADRGRPRRRRAHSPAGATRRPGAAGRAELRGATRLRA
jgi:hypothetical protein